MTNSLSSVIITKQINANLNKTKEFKMFSQILKQRQHSILANPATMPVCEDNHVSFNWAPESNILGQRGYDTQGFLEGEKSV